MSEPADGPAEEARLVWRAMQGDREAFGSLYDRYARAVHGVLLANVGPGEAEDLAQDVFLAAMRRLETLRDGSAFGGWLVSIARNTARDHHRRGRPRAMKAVETDLDGMPAVHALSASSADPETRLEAEAALEAVRSLPEAYRETLVLRLVEGMTGPEIARQTGLTPASVRVNLHRGMRLLRAKLGWSRGDE